MRDDSNEIQRNEFTFLCMLGKAVPLVDMCDVCEHDNVKRKSKKKIVRIMMMTPPLDFEILIHLRTTAPKLCEQWKHT